MMITGAALLCLEALPPAAAAGERRLMPPNPDKISAALVKRGVIPPTANPAEKEQAVSTYLQRKLSGGGPDRAYNPLARKRVDAMEAALNGQRGSVPGRKLGNTVSVEPSSPAFMQGPLNTGTLLLILVEFSDSPLTWTTASGNTKTAAGPLHDNIPVPDNTFDLWMPDFTRQHYEDMLFTPGGWTFPAGNYRYAGQHRESMRDYYLEQSYGKYTVSGQAYGWFKLNKPEAYYGDDSPDGGQDNEGPGTMKDLITDAVAVINSQKAIDWEAYDTNHDCIVDHPLFVHAGVDQSGGGGAQGDDAIWAHSSAVLVPVAAPTKSCKSGIFIYNYTIMPEDGGIGVFAHEFGHDLGLPDEYDTIYSGRGDSVAYRSLMSSGSWLGKPAQTQPPAISAWGRQALGWLVPGDNLGVTSLSQLQGGAAMVRLEQSERWGGNGTLNALRVNLPPRVYTINSPHSGSWEWFGGKADQIDTTLRRTVNLTGKSSATLSFWTWYDTEPGWDFAFVQVSTDGGITWTSLPIAGTTSTHDPEAMDTIVANLPGFTGNSGGWVNKTFNFSAYAGKTIQLQFRYMTDWGTTMAGIYIDDISVVADGVPVFMDTVESLDAAWVANGWTRDPGSVSVTHYYMLEWRNSNPFSTAYGTNSIVNCDAGLNNVYQFDPYGSTEPAYYAYAPGLVLWYRNMYYQDNWTGVHPGSGFLLVVDAHKQPMLRPPLPGYGSLPWSTTVQSYDAAFSLIPPPDVTLAYWGTTRTDPGLGAVPSFDDSLSYWSSVAPAASVQTPTYGLSFRVLGQATDSSAALVGLTAK